MITLKDFRQINEFLFEVPKSFRPDMLVPARIYIDKKMLLDILDERSVEQLLNVATLPGIEHYSLAMPDIHQGYGFPIGGVAAIRADDGVISPGGVGYDINCGVRMLLSAYHKDEIKDKVTALANQMQRDVPSGVGRGGKLVLDAKEMDKVLDNGLDWAEKRGYTEPGERERVEENGHYKAADSSAVSAKAKKRGADQLGTLGAGNHFLEIQAVDEIFDKKIAEEFGIFPGQAAVMIHTGSRGLGHETCTDYVRLMNQVMGKYGIRLPDRELACAPFKSEEGQRYFAAMAAAANFAWTNRQMIAHEVREAWRHVFEKKTELKTLYDVAHNIAKLERYDGKEYIVHRKGATRAFPGQPVIIPGSMGTASYVLVGTDTAMRETFGSSCHGAGREMSRAKAKKTGDYAHVIKELEERGVVVRAGSAREILEEAPEAYKDIESVVRVVHGAGIARKVARMRPLAVIKG